MVLEVIVYLYTLLGVLILVAIVWFGGGRSVTPTPSWTRSDAMLADVADTQHANTYPGAMTVHQLPPLTSCWPVMWVGPAAVAQQSPIVSVPAPAAALVPRRHPSSIATRVTVHGVTR